MSVTMYLQGGCSNQMSQYACGLSFAEKLGRRLLLNVDSFNADPVRMYSLHLFRGVADVITGMPSSRVIYEPGLRYCEDVELAVREHGDVMLWGYFQAHRYFDGVLPELRERFQPGSLRDCHKHTEAMIRNAGDRACFVTVRRTDYVDSSFHGLLPLDYYREAAEVIRSKVPNPYFFVFSDDPAWCGNSGELHKILHPMYIGGNYHRTVKPNLGREDAELYLMSLCRHAIMANSSYSAWGVHLMPNPGIVVAPAKWFGPTSNQDAEDIYRSEWIRI